MMERTYAASEKLAEIEREIAMRRRVYPGLISRGQMKQQQADDRIAVLSAIADDYRVLAQKERLL